jgi:hypothetical protein
MSESSKTESDADGNRFDEIEMDEGVESDPETQSSTTAGESVSSKTTGQQRELSESSPPFSYKQASVEQVYLKEGLETEFDDLQYEVENLLRREFDVRNVGTREIDTAVIQMVLQHHDAIDIARQIVSNRGFDPDRE